MTDTPDDWNLVEGARVLDEAILYTGRQHPSARLVFKILLFFPGGGTEAGQLAALNALADLGRDMADNLTHMQTADADPAPLDLDRFVADSTDTIRNRFASIGDTDRGGEVGLDLALFGSPFRTPENQGLTAFGGSVIANSPLVEGDADISTLEVSSSILWALQSGLDAQIARTKQAAEAIGAVHGFAGFSMQYDLITHGTTDHAAAIPVLARHPGVHCCYDTSFVVEAAMRRPEPDRYFSINWLTVLSDAMVQQAGGRSALGAIKGVTVHQFAGGVILQAGLRPEPGDINRGQVPDLYRAVSDATKAVRFEDYGAGLWPVQGERESLAQTLAWVKRFD